MQDRIRIVLPRSHVPVIHPTLFFDDMAGTAQYTVTGDGSGYSAVYTTAAPYVGTKCLQLATQPTSPASGEKVAASKYLWAPPTKLIRLQLIFAHYTGGNCWFYVRTYYYTGSTIYAPEIAFERSSGTVYYAATVAGTYTDTGLTWTVTSLSWNHLNLTFNLDTGRFHTLVVNANHADMRSISLPSSASSTTQRLHLILEIENQAAAQSKLNVDQILLTADNP